MANPPSVEASLVTRACCPGVLSVSHVQDFSSGGVPCSVLKAIRNQRKEISVIKNPALPRTMGQATNDNKLTLRRFGGQSLLCWGKSGDTCLVVTL